MRNFIICVSHHTFIREQIKEVKWTGNVACIFGIRNAYISVINPERRRRIVKFWRRCNVLKYSRTSIIRTNWDQR